MIVGRTGSFRCDTGAEWRDLELYRLFSYLLRCNGQSALDAWGALSRLKKNEGQPPINCQLEQFFLHQSV
jgi:hypothetical protein